MNKRVILKVDDELYLRQLVERSAKPYFDCFEASRKHLARHNPQDALKYPTIDAVRDSIIPPHLISKKRYRLHFGIWAERTFVGSIYVDNVNSGNMFLGEEADIRYWLGKDFLGNGYATRSVRRIVRYCRCDLGLENVFARVDENNFPSIKVLERAGLKRMDYPSDELVYWTR